MGNRPAWRGSWCLANRSRAIIREMARLSRVVFLLRDLQQGLRFYRDGLGLRVDAHTESFARLCTSNHVPIELNLAERYVDITCTWEYSITSP